MKVISVSETNNIYTVSISESREVTRTIILKHILNTATPYYEVSTESLNILRATVDGDAIIHSNIVDAIKLAVKAVQKFKEI